jgi:superfamily II DNA helicase RecQ
MCNERRSAREMTVRIFTVPFDPVRQVFPDEELGAFLLNKAVKTMQAQFFQANGNSYWTVFVEYETVVGPEPSDRDHLDEAGQLLMKRLSQWRKETADREKVPVFIIATNRQLLDVVKQSPSTLEALRSINGFGPKKLDRYGGRILEIIKTFYEKKPLYGAKGQKKPNRRKAGRRDSHGQA